MANFVVSAPAVTRFPLDMLRHDQCWPASPIDASRISASILQDPYLLEMKRVEIQLVCTSPRDITCKRWASFGWFVARIEGHDTALLPTSVRA